MAANRWDQLIEHWSGRMRRAFLEAVQKIKDDAQIEQITRMLDHDDIEGALRAAGLDPALFDIWHEQVRQAYQAGGIATAEGLPIVRDQRGFQVRFQFSIRNPLAEEWLSRRSSLFVTEVFDDQRQMIRDVLRGGMAAGQNPRAVALDLVGRIGPNGRRLGGLIGLTNSQAQWVRNYSVELVDDLPAALTRKLRDRRFDAAIKKAIKEERAIPAEMRQKMVTAYQNRALRYRAETIARTEAMQSLHAAQDAAMTIAMQQGAVNPDAVTFIWRTARDNRVRDTHQTMDGQQRANGQPFITGSGAHLRYPGDPLGPAAEIINCRCWREPRVDFLRGIR